MSETLIKVENLKKYFPIKKGITRKTVGYVKAVDNVSFEIKEGETIGLVGESGCGKTTTGRTILRLLDKTDGNVYYRGQDVHELSKKEMRALRDKVQIIFQDPYSSLNPRLTVGKIVGEGLEAHRDWSKEEIDKKVMDTLELCGLAPHHARRYPHEFSGGQRQRVGIARALALDPEFIVCDEAVSALDVSIQAQVINFLTEVQKEKGFAYLFITHDLSVVKHVSHKIGVMYLGSMVEFSTKEDLYENPLHPYTKALLSAIPIPDPTVKIDRVILEGDIPSPANPPSGCKFHTRCQYAIDKCKTEVPEYREIKEDHFVACHIVE